MSRKPPGAGLSVPEASLYPPPPILCRFLHNEMMYAVAQKRYLYIYDHTGMELHCLKEHSHVNRLTFLPYHFLLVSAVSEGGGGDPETVSNGFVCVSPLG